MHSDNEKRQAEFVRGWKEKSQAAGDHHWRMVNGWTGEGDYQAGKDDGEPPHKAVW